MSRRVRRGKEVEILFERYTERARRVIFWARYIAHQTGSREIEPEDLLAGLLREDMSLAGRFLGSPWVLEEVWRKVEQNRPIQAKSLGSVDVPLDNASKRVLAFAAEEADSLLSKRIGTAHLLLGFLREEKSLTTEILNDRGVLLASTRDDLARAPHDDSVVEKFVREQRLLPTEVIETENRIKQISSQMNTAIADRDFAEAQALSNEEREARDKLFFLCQEHGLSEWLYA